jgi:hypothetical protein
MQVIKFGQIVELITGDVIVLELCGGNRHAEADFEALSTVGGGDVGELVHEGSLPSFHDWLSLDGEMRIGVVVIGHGIGPVGSAVLLGGENLWLVHVASLE